MPDIMCHALWACSHAESLDDPGLRLDRPDLPGEELRTTNFGGGSISAKVKHKDPLPGDQVQVLSGMDPGRDIGSIKLDRYAPLASIDCYRAAGYHKHKTSERPTVAGPTAGIV